MRSIRVASSGLVLAIAAFGCESGTDRGPVRASFSIEPGPATPEGEEWLGPDEAEIRGMLHLVVTGQDGDDELLDGIVAIYGEEGTTMTEISARNQGGLISIDESSVSFADRDVRISWSRFELSLRDSTGDEVLDTGSGAFEAELFWNEWDPQAPYGGERVSDGVVTLHPETRAPEARIRAGGFDAQIAFPDQNAVVDFTEPVVRSEVEDAIALYVDGEPIDYEFRAHSFNELEIDGQARPLVLRATLTPTEPLPLDSEATISVEGLTDLGGAPVKATGSVATATDRGSALDNLTFEDGLDHWHALGDVHAIPQFEDREASVGGQFAVLRPSSRLVGILDVPEDAEALSMQLALWSQADWGASGELVVRISTFPEGERISTHTAGPTYEDLEPCEPCSSLYPYRIEPHVVTIDMEEAAGRSVYLRIENRPDDVIRPYGADIASQPDIRIAAAIDELWLESE